MRLPSGRMLTRELLLLRRPALMPRRRLRCCSERWLLPGRRLLRRKRLLLLRLRLAGRRRLRCKGG